MEVVLDDNGLKEFIDVDIPKPASSDVSALDAWKKKVAKCTVGRCEGPNCVQPSWESHSILNVEGFDRLVPKQK